MFLCVKLYLLSSWFFQREMSFISCIVDFANRIIFSCWVPGKIKAGKGLVLGYGGLGVVIHHDTVLGDRVHIDQNVTIGGNATEFGVPTIGDDVYIGCGAKILGPITIGDNCVVAANAVVINDIPSNSVVGGIPAKVIHDGIVLNDFLYHLKGLNLKKKGKN